MIQRERLKNASEMIERLVSAIEERNHLIETLQGSCQRLREGILDRERENRKIRDELQSQAKSFVTAMLTGSSMHAEGGYDPRFDCHVMEVSLRPATYRRVIPYRELIQGGPEFEQYVRREIAEIFAKFLAEDWLKQTKKTGEPDDDSSDLSLAGSRDIPGVAARLLWVSVRLHKAEHANKMLLYGYRNMRASYDVILSENLDLKATNADLWKVKGKCLGCRRTTTS